MPVSVVVKIIQQSHGLKVLIRTEGREAELVASGREFFRGVTGFFKELSKTKKISKKRIKQLSQKQETEFAESVGGSRQKGSGALIGHKGDGRVRGRYRIENKYRTAKSYSVSLSDLRKIRAECEGLEVPVFDILFRDKHTHQPVDNWVLIPKDHWEKLVNADTKADDNR